MIDLKTWRGFTRFGMALMNKQAEAGILHFPAKRAKIGFFGQPPAPTGFQTVFGRSFWVSCKIYMLY
jgi:hypothetical protein